MLENDETCPTCNGLGSRKSRLSLPLINQNHRRNSTSKFNHSSRISDIHLPILQTSKSNSSQTKIDVEDYTALLDQNFLKVEESFENPQEVLKGSLEKLKDNQWQTSTPALINLMQIARFQPELLDSMMGLVNRNLCSLLNNIRPQIVRTACQLAREFYKSIQYAQRPEFDRLIGLLLLKSTHMKKGIREDARNALKTIVQHLSPTITVRILTGDNETGHKNQFVRAVISMLLCDIVELIGPDLLLSSQNLKEVCRRVLTSCLKFLVDGNLETRNNAKKALKLMMTNNNFELLCTKYIDPKLAKFVNPQLVTLKYG